MPADKVRGHCPPTASTAGGTPVSVPTLTGSGVSPLGLPPAPTGAGNTDGGVWGQLTGLSSCPGWAGPALGLCVGTCRGAWGPDLPGSQGSPAGQGVQVHWSQRSHSPRALLSLLSARHRLGRPSRPVGENARLRQPSSPCRRGEGRGLTSRAVVGRVKQRELLEPRPPAASK